MTETERVRFAEPGDEMSLLALMDAVHQESGLFPIDPIAALAMIGRCIARRDAVIGTIGPVGAVRAAVCLTIERMWYASADNGRFLSEKFMIVAPEHRRSTHAKNLLLFSKEVARGLGIKLLIGVASNERTAAKVRLYRSQFPMKIGESFMFDGAA